METEKKPCIWAIIVCALVLGLLLFFFSAISVRMLAKAVLVEHYGINNRFTDAVLADMQETAAEGDGAAVYIDWAALYPFTDDGAVSTAAQGIQINMPWPIRQYENKVKRLKNMIEPYTTDELWGYHTIVGLANRYKRVIRWAYASYAEHNGVVPLPDGWLTEYVQKRDVSLAVENTLSFAEYCRQNDTAFLYMQAPYKVSKVQDSSISGALDYSNQNADELIEQLRRENVAVYDFRDQIEAEGLDHHSLFYRTDHHWRAETGLWAARHILEYLQQQYACDVDPELLSPERFSTVEYPGWLLGARGKKVTTAVTEPDDFSLLYPNYETSLHFSIPDIGLDADGDFSITYDMSQVAEINYYGLYPYHAYMYGDHALARFENHLAENELRLLFIHDSFGNSVLPFVSLGVKYVDSLDPRHFTGSIHSFIEETRPDLVIVLYNPSYVKSDGDLHRAFFDFR